MPQSRYVEVDWAFFLSGCEGVHVRVSGSEDAEERARTPSKRERCWRCPIAGPRRERDWRIRLIAEEQSEKASNGTVLEASTETEMPKSS
jgi:hypothetical protein